MANRLRTTTNLLKQLSTSRSISTETRTASQQPIPSTSSASPSSSAPVKKKGTRLRDRAGLPAFEGSSKRTGDHHDNQGEDGTGHQTFTPMKPWNMRTRNQLERTQMSHRESAIALELLEDLAIPLEEISTTDSNHHHDQEVEQGSGTIKDLLNRPEFQSILSQKSSSNKSLSRHRPNQLSSEDLRVEDIFKEMTDSLLRQIDSFQTDFELLNWLDQQVFSHSKPTLTTPSDQASSSSSSSSINQPQNTPSNKLGDCFVGHSIPKEFELDINFDQDPETILQQPICFTPLFSTILPHLIETFHQKFKNPHLSLYLFDWVRSHPDPFVKYFGLTRDVYFIILSIKCDVFRDFKGIQEGLIGMKSSGLELDDRFKRLINSITELILEDEIQAEQNLLLHLDSPDTNNTSQDFGIENNLDTFRKISNVDRIYVSQIEAILNEFIESQNIAFTHKFRSPPSSHKSFSIHHHN
ncbi:hypothetical protein PSTG_02176 [Puccinia striiformis f. sp. tritici PST-78]|uniref:Mtf2-like C-terminal domain-containing protein n=1 Tax=Puccinia striiformis f. sp. tritici PST-78 TaxID=1165861 RepID=A0A0L0VZI8_9BASI|nr:hypothetical protein PSTG_02176 [Puccinia striiformis f. sp. tritici PST-78]